MTTPSKISPVEALIRAKTCIESENMTLFEKQALKMFEAAIPVAELEHEAVELLEELYPFVYSGGHYTEEAHRRITSLLTKIKALKCNPQK